MSWRIDNSGEVHVLDDGPAMPWWRGPGEVWDEDTPTPEDHTSHCTNPGRYEERTYGTRYGRRFIATTVTCPSCGALFDKRYESL